MRANESPLDVLLTMAAGSDDPICSAIPTSESLRGMKRLRPDRCIGWMQRTCVCSCGRRKRSSGRMEYVSGADQRHGCRCAKRGKENLRLDRGRTNGCTQGLQVNHLHVLLGCWYFLAEFYRATVRSSDGASKQQRSAEVCAVCVYGVPLIGCSQERLLGIIASMGTSSCQIEVEPSLCTVCSVCMDSRGGRSAYM
jgi:hypothetical protein